MLVDERQRVATRIAMVTRPETTNPAPIIDRALQIAQCPTDIWNHLETRARRGFQRLLYPDGMVVDAGVFRTPLTACFFNDLQALHRGGEVLGSPNGHDFEPESAVYLLRLGHVA